MEAIKITLVNIKGNFKEQAQDWKDNWSVLVNMDNQKSLPQRQNQRFKLEEQNEPKVDPRHLAHYTLLWIACINDYFNLHYMPKTKHSKYPRKTEWDSSKKKF